MTELLWLAVFAAASYGLGSATLQLAGIRSSSFGEQAIFSEGIGLAALAYLTLILGILGELDSTHYKIAAVVIAALSYPRLKELAASFYRTAKRSYNRRQKLNSALILLLAVVAVLNIIAAMAPVHASDAAAYHVATAKIYAEQGRIANIPFMVTASYPMITEMLFLDGYLLAGGKLSQMIAAFIALLAAVAIYVFTKKYFGKETGLVAAAIFYTLPLVSVFNVRGFVDISAALFGMLAVFALINWKERGDAGMLALTGIFAGAAAATKISAYPIAAVMGLAVAYTALVVKRQGIANAAKSMAVYAAAAGAVVAPWLARAYDYTGNPFYPLLTGIFGGAYMPHGLAQFWVDSLSFIGFGTGITALAKLPWNMTMHSTAFGEQLGIGPVFLAFIPLLLIFRKIDRKIIAMLAICAILLLAWFYTAQSLRYIFFVYALLSIAAAYAIKQLSEAKNMRIVAVLIVAATFLMNCAFWLGANNDELRVVSGITDEDSYIEGKMQNYGLLKFANNDLPGAKLCLYGEIRGYYSDNDYVWCHPLFQAYINFYTTTATSDILAQMKAAGVTHVLVEKNIGTFEHYSKVPASKAVIENADRIIEDITRNHARKVFENDNGTIYKIIYS